MTGKLPLAVDGTTSSPAQTSPLDPTSGTHPTRRAALQLLAIYGLMRVVALVADLCAACLWKPYKGDLFAPMLSWDALHYMSIAENGYPHQAPLSDWFFGHLTYSSAGFEPGFPMLVGLTHVVVRSYDAAALVVSILAGAVGTLLVWRLGVELRGRSAGFRAAVLFTVFPGMATAWGMFYAECVAIPLAAGALLLMIRQSWGLAGIVGMMATATSPLALPLAVAALVPCVKALRRGVWTDAVVTAVLTPVGFLAFAAWLGIRYRDALFWWHLQHQAWGASVDFGKGLLLTLPHLSAGGPTGRGWLEWIGITAVAATAVALWKAKLPALINVYCLALFVLVFISNQLGFKPRLLAWGFPALIAVAATVPRRWWLIICLGFALLFPVLVVAYTVFGNTMIQP